MSEPEYLYIAFNDETSAFRDDSNYLTYYYKGFYGLLLLSCQDYDFELYRGVNYTVPAEVNQYLRFNRFLSSSKNFGIAQKYANSSTGQGTIFVIQGTKHANHIAPYSIVQYVYNARYSYCKNYHAEALLFFIKSSSLVY